MNVKLFKKSGGDDDDEDDDEKFESVMQDSDAAWNFDTVKAALPAGTPGSKPIVRELASRIPPPPPKSSENDGGEDEKTVRKL